MALNHAMALFISSLPPTAYASLNESHQSHQPQRPSRVPRRIHIETVTPRPSVVPDPKSIPSTPPQPPHIVPLYTARNVQFSSDSRAITTNTFLRFLLLSDGHIVQHLSILTSNELTIRLQSVIYHPPNYPHRSLSTIPPYEQPPSFESGTVQRTIALLGPNETPLLYATSTWSKDAYERIMGDRQGQSLWEAFVDLKLHVSRKILAVYYGTCPELAQLFDVDKDTHMFARDYMFRIEQRPFLIVHEIFSPTLHHYLGELTPPRAVLEHWQQKSKQSP